MKDALFLQFYSRRKSGIYNLLNGFSDTFDLCRQHGELYWMKEDPDATRWYQYERYADNSLPIKQGTIYVSALDVNHLYQCWVWAREYPGMQFVVGGPVVAERAMDANRWHPAYVRVDDPPALPPNLSLTGKSVEDWFGVADFSGRWHLELPDNIADGNRIYFSYTLDNTCFWSRCTYCNIGHHDRRRIRRREKMIFEFQDLPFHGTKLVRLNTGSISPRQIRSLFPILPFAKDFEYRTFMRPSRAENIALGDAIAACKGNFPNVILGYGVEFPTQRMLNHIDKGFTPQELLDSLALCAEHNIGVNGNVIVGWDNLTPNDILELEHFFKSIPAGAFKNIQLRWLFAHPFTAIHDHFHGHPVTFGPFYEGFSVRLDDIEQITLNEKAIEIIVHYGTEKKFTVEGLAKVQDRLKG